MKKTFYDEISGNKWRTILLFVMFFILVAIIGIVLGVFFFRNLYAGLIVTLIIGIVYSLIMYKSGASTILSAVKAKPVTKQQDPYLYHVVEGLAIAAGLKVKPKIYMIEEDSMNAFATGISPEKSYICVTSGLRKKMNRQELEGVIAHEMSHIKNFDIRVMLLAAVLVGVIILISDIMLRSFLWGGAGRSRGGSRDNGGAQIVLILIALGLAILAPIIAQMIKLAISRKREYLADASAVQLTRNPSGLASALSKIKNDTDTVVDTVNKATAHLFIENPLRHKKKITWIASMFNTHPPIDKRISRLNTM